MAEFDFDAPIDRVGGRFHDSNKWNRYAGRDILPLWVADMDFAAPPAVVAALHQRVDHGVFGYPDAWPTLEQAVVHHLAQAYGWAIETDWLVWLPGLVSALHVACRAVGGEDDTVFSATPVYPPFLSAPGNSGRRLVTAPLVQADDKSWQWDFNAVGDVLQRENPRLWLFCHPHNPVGRVWNDEELQAVAALAEARDLVVCSDEIHCDLILKPGQRHRPLASVSPAMAARTITLMAPSKTFNVPGLGCAFAVIPNADLRRRFRRAMTGIVPDVNVLGLVACEAAYRYGGPWRGALLDYLRRNAVMVTDAVNNTPGLTMAPVEATYLAWIDARGLGLQNPHAAFEAAGLGLSDGAAFAAPGFVRLNFGCRRALLQEALERLGRLRPPT